MNATTQTADIFKLFTDFLTKAADYVEQTDSTIARIKSEANDKIKAAEKRVQLVKVASCDQIMVGQLVDNLVALGMIKQSNRNETVNQFTQDPNRVVTLCSEIITPLLKAQSHSTGVTVDTSALPHDLFSNATELETKEKELWSKVK